MKLGLLTKIDGRNRIMSKKIDDDVISENRDVISIFFILQPIWSNPEIGFRTHSL